MQQLRDYFVLLCSALEQAVNTARADVRINQIGRAVQDIAQNGGYTVIRNLGGHGVGSALHEEPRFIANYFDKKDDRVLKMEWLLQLSLLFR